MIWVEKKIGELLKLQRGHDLPSSKRNPGSIPIISSSGITDFHDDFKSNGEGVVTGRYGTLGEVFYVKGKYWPLNTALYVKDFKGNHPKFIYYFLKSIHLERYNGAAAVPGIDRNVIHKLRVKFPIEICTQKKIASILSAYDDLIGNNSQRIQLLEGMAEEIYKEWFVRLRFPGYQDSKYFDKDGNEVPNDIPGALPEGWENVKSSKICSFPYGKMPEDKSMIHSSIYPYEIQSGHGCKGYTSKINIEEPSIIITVRGSVGRVEILYNKCWITNLSVVVKFSDEIRSLHYLFHEYKRQKLEWLNTGSAIPQITSGDLGFVKVLLPTEKIQTKFEEVVSPIYRQIELLKNKNNVLQETRDLLLPRLISGKLSVKDIEIEQELLNT